MLFQITACSNQNSLTREQLEIQSRADSAASSVLFEHELDETASYNIRTDGFLVIKFPESVADERCASLLVSNSCVISMKCLSIQIQPDIDSSHSAEAFIELSILLSQFFGN